MILFGILFRLEQLAYEFFKKKAHLLKYIALRKFIPNIAFGGATFNIRLIFPRRFSISHVRC